MALNASTCTQYAVDFRYRTTLKGFTRLQSHHAAREEARDLEIAERASLSTELTSDLAVESLLLAPLRAVVILDRLVYAVDPVRDERPVLMG